MIVIIPTNRSVRLEYLQPLIETGARFLIIDDSEGSVTVNHPQFEVYTWKDRRDRLGDLDIAIPKRNGACRDFGFYLAWQEAAADEEIVCLDDDCLVEDADYAAQVRLVLSDVPRPMAVTNGAHLNIVDFYSNSPVNLFPRGFPYSARANYEKCQFDSISTPRVKFSLGLWKGIFDINAIDKLKGPPYKHDDARLHHPSVILPPKCLVSVCSMNMHLRRDVIPAVYQLPMHVEVLPGWVIDRYGDIWGGFMLKALMDRRGDMMAVGGPMIRHLKEGDYYRNIWQEHLCHLVNDEFIEVLDESVEQVRPGNYLDMVEELTECFRARTDSSSPILKAYFKHLTIAMGAWVRALRG